MRIESDLFKLSMEKLTFTMKAVKSPPALFCLIHTYYCTKNSPSPNDIRSAVV